MTQQVSEAYPSDLIGALTGFEPCCRREGLVAFRVSDFDRDAGTISVRASKAGRPRQVVLTDDGVALFERHIAVGIAPAAKIRDFRDGHPQRGAANQPQDQG